MKAQDMMKEITSKILTDLKSGVNVFEMPFKGNLKGLPKNHKSGKVYQGYNFWNITEKAQDMGFLKNEYMTFKQAGDLGFKVKKGAKGLPVFFYKSLQFDESGKIVKGETKRDDLKEVPFLSLSYVFNIGQLEGEGVESIVGLKADSTLIDADRLIDISKIGATVQTHAAASAYYNRTDDVIMIPNIGLFTDKSRYWSTVAHELIHWTGAETRLERKKGREFGDYDYKREELVAEFGAAYLMAYLGGEYNSQHAAYIKGWSKDLKEDDVNYAIRESQKAANYIISKLESEAA